MKCAMEQRHFQSWQGRGEGGSQVVGTVGRVTPDKVVTLEAAGGRWGPSQILAAATAAKHHYRGL